MVSVAGFFTYAVKGLFQAGRGILNFPFVVKFTVVYLYAVIFLYINAPAIYGEEAARWQGMLTIYLVVISFSFSLSGRANPLTHSTIEFLAYFVGVAALGAAIFKGLQPFNPERALLTSESVAILVTHGLVIAIGEELVYRYALPVLIPGPPMVGQTLSALAFGATHYFAYGGDIATILWASTLGFIFGAITAYWPRHGLVVAMALHFAWNSATLGYI